MSRKHKQNKEWKAEKNALEQMTDSTESDKLYNSFDQYQKQMDRDIEEKSAVFVDEPAGTGKTTIAVRKGLALLREGRIDKIHYVRFPDARSMKLGFLPGDLQGGKEKGFMTPFYDAMAECGVQPEAVDLMVVHGSVELSTDIHMRGRNLKGVYLIIDEAQNSSDLSDLKTVLTRLHDHRGKGVVIGHSGQVDGKVKLYTKHRLTAFQVYTYHMTRKPWATRSYLVNNYRGEIAKWADRVEESLITLEGMDEV